jgi:hypothetical protein
MPNDLIEHAQDCWSLACKVHSKETDFICEGELNCGSIEGTDLHVKVPCQVDSCIGYFYFIAFGKKIPSECMPNFCLESFECPRQVALPQPDKNREYTLEADICIY